jgi:hypothetical protein
MEIKEGYMPFMGYQTYYRIVGKTEEGKNPIILLQKTYIIGKTNVILDSLKAGDIVGDICTGFYKIRKKTSFRLLYFIPPQKIGYVILPYMYNEKANRLYVKNISDYITTPDTKYLYSIDDNHLIWIENTPSYEKIPNEVCRLQIYNHPSLSVERELKEEYFKK